MRKPVSKRTHGFVLVTLILSFVQLAEAQESRKIARIGILFTTTPALTAHLLEVFKEGMRKLGNVEGKNFIIEPRYAETKDEQVPRPRCRIGPSENGCYRSKYQHGDRGCQASDTDDSDRHAERH